MTRERLAEIRARLKVVMDFERTWERRTAVDLCASLEEAWAKIERVEALCDEANALRERAKTTATTMLACLLHGRAEGYDNIRAALRGSDGE